MEEGEERRAVVDREKLRAMRRAKNLTQESLSERGNISVRYLRSLETRDCNPSVSRCTASAGRWAQPSRIF